MKINGITMGEIFNARECKYKRENYEMHYGLFRL